MNPQLIDCGHRLLGSPRAHQKLLSLDSRHTGSPGKHALNTVTPSPCAQSPPRGTEKNHSNPTFRMERLKKSQGIPRPALGRGGGRLKWGEMSWPHGRRAAAFGLALGRFSFMSAKRLPFSPSNYRAASHQDGC